MSNVSGRVVRSRLETIVRSGQDPRAAAREASRRWLLWQDAGRLHRTLGPAFRQDAIRAGTAPDVLFTPIGDWPWQVKLEATFAKAMAGRGATPGFLVHRGAWPRVRRYTAAFGVANPVFLDDYLDTAPEAEVEGAVEAVAKQQWSLAGAQAVEHRGWPLGRAALSTAVAGLRSQGVSMSSAAVRDRFLREFGESVRLAHAADRLFAEYQLRAVWFLERNYLPWGAVAEVAIGRGLNVIQYGGSHRSDGFVLRRVNRANRFQHPFALGARSWTKVRAMPWDDGLGRAAVALLEQNYQSGQWFHRKYATQGKRFLPPEEVRSRLALRAGRKVACIFPHILWDGTFGYGQTLFGDYEAWLLRTLEAACKNDRLDWLVKIHPDHLWKSRSSGTVRSAEEGAIGRVFGELPEHVRILPPDTDIQTYSLYPVLDCGVTVRGTVGIEMSCLGVPVVTGGTGRYSGLGFTIDPANEDEYLRTLAGLEGVEPLIPSQVELARRHAWALFELRPWVVTSVRNRYRPISEAQHPLASDVEFVVRTPEALVRAPDLRAMVEWVLGSDEEDYLAEQPTEAAPRQPAVAA